jgi:aminocarboxymuconate-semialdehyde decarboxylase
MNDVTVDVHAHALIAEVEAMVRGEDGWRRAAEQAARLQGRASVEHNRKLAETVYAQALTSVDARLAAMDRMGIDVQAVSLVPTQYHYWAERRLAEWIVETANDKIAATCAARPDRLVGLGTVSLQFPESAAAQLERLMRRGLRGVIVSTAVSGAELADERHEQFWAAAEELAALLFIHPMGCSLGSRLTPYYFSNVIGNPIETTLALAHLIFAGVLDRHPRLKICAAHGGGYFPFYIGRFDHGWRVRPEAHTCEHPPSKYLHRIWFDSLVYAPDQLEFLIRRAGASQVMIGTDYPFDMGVDDSLARLDAVTSLSHEDRSAVRGANAARLLKIEH